LDEGNILRCGSNEKSLIFAFNQHQKALFAERERLTKFQAAGTAFEKAALIRETRVAPSDFGSSDDGALAVFSIL
jgi:hypothetical protein